MPVFIFFSTIVVSFLLTAGVILFMRHVNIVDRPKKAERKIHKRIIPLGGGVAPFVVFLLAVSFLYTFGFLNGTLQTNELWGIIAGSLIVVFGGVLDDKFNLSATKQIIFPILAALTVIGFGIGPHEITNPLGGIISLDQIKFPFGPYGTFVLFADLLVFGWLMTVMYSTKLLDGLDGLVSGVSVIGAFVIFFLTQKPDLFQPEVGLLAIAFAGAMTGFLIWNYNPAKIFLGEGGSLFAGFILGTLAIISGSKIATTLLVLAVPLLDVIRVFFVRIIKGKPFYQGDKEHLHFRLLSIGYSHKTTVLIYYILTLVFGVIGIYAKHINKLLLLGCIFIILFGTNIVFLRHDKQQLEK